MYDMKKALLSDKFRMYLSLALCGLGTVLILAMYIGGNDEKILYNSILFTFIVLINRLRNAMIHKKKSSKYLYFSEICFAIYLVVIAISGQKYLLWAKLLMIPSVIIMFIQTFGLRAKKDITVKS